MISKLHGASFKHFSTIAYLEEESPSCMVNTTFLVAYLGVIGSPASINGLGFIGV